MVRYRHGTRIAKRAAVHGRRIGEPVGTDDADHAGAQTRVATHDEAVEPHEHLCGEQAVSIRQRLHRAVQARGRERRGVAAVAATVVQHGYLAGRCGLDHLTPPGQLGAPSGGGLLLDRGVDRLCHGTWCGQRCPVPHGLDDFHQLLVQELTGPQIGDDMVEDRQYLAGDSRDAEYLERDRRLGLQVHGPAAGPFRQLGRPRLARAGRAFHHGDPLPAGAVYELDGCPRGVTGERAAQLPWRRTRIRTASHTASASTRCGSDQRMARIRVQVLCGARSAISSNSISWAS